MQAVAAGSRAVATNAFFAQSSMSYQKAAAAVAWACMPRFDFAEQEKTSSRAVSA